jgi:hypothetical protein
MSGDATPEAGCRAYTSGTETALMLKLLDISATSSDNVRDLKFKGLRWLGYIRTMSCVGPVISSESKPHVVARITFRVTRSKDSCRN